MSEFLSQTLASIRNFLNKDKETLHGSASWNDYKWNILKQGNNGLTINGRDRITAENSYRHSVIIAPAGAGKTTTYIIPNVLNLDYSMIITDPSGEIYRATKDTLIKKFFNIKIINPNDLSKTSFYNPLERANTPTEIQKISESLINNAYEGDTSTSKNDFWNDGAISILSLIIQAVKANHDSTKRNLQEVRRFLLLYGQIEGETKTDKLANEIMKHLRHDANAMSELTSFYADDQKVRTNFITTCKTALKMFIDPNICKLTSSDTINFEDIKDQQKRPTAIFLIVPEHDIKHYSFLLNLFYTQVFNYCAIAGIEEGTAPEDTKSVFFLLDEFGNMGRLPNFTSIITTLRKRNCSISIILQDIKQLNATYGTNNAETIFSNCSSKIFFSGLEETLCKRIEAILGKATLTQKDKETGKTTLHGRSLMTADEIRRLHRSQIIYIFANERPFLLPVSYYKKPIKK